MCVRALYKYIYMHRIVHVCIYICLNKCIHVHRIHKWISGWMDGYLDEWVGDELHAAGRPSDPVTHDGLSPGEINTGLFVLQYRNTCKQFQTCV